MKNNTTTTTTTTTRFSLGFRHLARVEGRRWLSKINKNTQNAAATHHSSASGKQPAPQTSISQSQVNRGTNFDLPTKELKTTTITGSVMFQSTNKDNLPHCTQTVVVADDTHPTEDDCEQQEGKNAEKVKNINEKNSDDRNHFQEEIKDVDQRLKEYEKQGHINEVKRKNPEEDAQLRKAQRREVLLARLRARIEKSEARFRHLGEQNHTFRGTR